MADKKKLSSKEIIIEELTDEQANNVAGGLGIAAFSCDCCGRSYKNSTAFRTGNKIYCGVCFAKMKREEQEDFKRN